MEYDAQKKTREKEKWKSNKTKSLPKINWPRFFFFVAFQKKQRRPIVEAHKLD